MANNDRPTKHLEWEGNAWTRHPLWPSEPKIEVIRSLARQHLQDCILEPFNDDSFAVSFLAEGAFNKVYQVSYVGHATTYIFRVAMPMIPCDKVESEIATMAYVRANTSIPLPIVFAWNSNQNNELGFEWILMEKVAGVPLVSVWRQLTWTQKLGFTEKLAGYVNELRQSKFDYIGGLYLKSPKSAKTRGRDEVSRIDDSDAPNPNSWLSFLWQNVGSFLNGTARSLFTDSEHTFRSRVNSPDEQTQHSQPLLEQSEFTIGNGFGETFYRGCRICLPGNRGPYHNTREWLTAIAQIQLAWIQHGPVDSDNEYDKDYEKDHSLMTWLCHSFIEQLPEFFPEDDTDGSFILNHSDLNAQNILVDPETFEILHIIDWEHVQTVPKWFATRHPECLNFMAPFSDERKPPPVPEIIDEEDGSMDQLDRWEFQLLREHYDECLRELDPDGKGRHETAQVVEQRMFFEHLGYISTGMTDWSQKWLTRVTRKKAAVERGVVDRFVVDGVFLEESVGLRDNLIG